MALMSWFVYSNGTKHTYLLPESKPFTAVGEDQELHHSWKPQYTANP